MPHSSFVDPARATPVESKLQRARRPRQVEHRGEMASRRASETASLTKLQQAKLVLALWRERIQARRALRELCALDDYALKDIGLVRSQVVFEASKPFWR